MNPEQLAQQLGQFQAETTKMDMKESTMTDMFDELFEDESDEADSIMNQVLDELSIENAAKLAKLPTTSKDVIGGVVSSTSDKTKSNLSGVREKHQ